MPDTSPDPARATPAVHPILAALFERIERDVSTDRHEALLGFARA
jgi:hypothetical protein